jgi:hypothetical protein
VAENWKFEELLTNNDWAATRPTSLVREPLAEATEFGEDVGLPHHAHFHRFSFCGEKSGSAL